MKWILKTIIWAVFFAALIILSSCGGIKHTAGPFEGRTSTKPLQGRLTQQQWRQAILGEPIYTRFAGKQMKNTNRVQQLKRH
jgi:hypothetical protein